LREMVNSNNILKIRSACKVINQQQDPIATPMLDIALANPAFCSPTNTATRLILAKTLVDLAHPEVLPLVLKLVPHLQHAGRDLLVKSLKMQIHSRYADVVGYFERGSVIQKRIILDAMMESKKRDRPELLNLLKKMIWEEFSRTYYILGCSQQLTLFGKFHAIQLLRETYLEKYYYPQKILLLQMIQIMDGQHQLDSIIEKVDLEDVHLRASIFELIETTVESKLARVLLPLLEKSDPVEILKHGENLWKHSLPSPQKLLKELVHSEDKWLKAVASYGAFCIVNEDKTKLSRGEMEEIIGSKENIRDWASKNMEISLNG